MIIKAWFCGAPEHEERCTLEEPFHLSSSRAKRRTNAYFCGSVDRAIRCDGEGCTNEIELKDSRYDMLKAASQDGWFFAKDHQSAYCFEHLSVGLIAWRDRNNPGWRGRLRKGMASKLPSVESARRVAETSRIRYTGKSRDATLPEEGESCRKSQKSELPTSC